MAVQGITIHGWIELPAPELFDNAVAIVGLDDVTMIDARATRLAETVIRPVKGQLGRIPFSLEVRTRLSARNSYVLTAEIRRASPSHLRPDDFATTVAIPWTARTSGECTVPVSRV